MTGEPRPLVLIASFVLGILAIFLIRGFFLIAPNEAKVLQLFGDYAGTAKDPGLRWANPFLTRKKLSLRVRNFEGSKLKVNDAEGNPIEIAAVVVWRVVETAEAMFEVDDYQNYVRVQSEAALRNAATSYPYDCARGARRLAARQHGGGRRAPAERSAAAAAEGRRRGDRGADQPSGVRAGDRRRDAAAAAGRGDHRRAPAYR